MRIMMLLKASKNSEAGVMPRMELLTEMGKYNESLIAAGALIDAAGLQASSKGARVRFTGSKVGVTDGPFAETKELLAGYWLIDVESLDEAIAWAKRCPPPHPGEDAEIELRPMFETADFEDAPEAVVKQEAAFRSARKRAKKK